MPPTTQMQPTQIRLEGISTKLKNFNSLQVENRKLASADMQNHYRLLGEVVKELERIDLSGTPEASSKVIEAAGKTCKKIYVEILPKDGIKLEWTDLFIRFTEATLRHMNQLDKNKFTLLANLGIAYKSRFIRFGRLKDIDYAISHLSQASNDVSNQLDQCDRLNALAASYILRFGLLGEDKDAMLAVRQDKEALHLTESKELEGRYQRLASLSHSKAKLAETVVNQKQALTLHGEAINHLLEAIKIAPKKLPDLPWAEWHTNLGDLYHSQSKISDSTEQRQADITEATKHWDEAVVLAKKQTRPSLRLSAALGYSYMTRAGINSSTDRKNLAESALQYYLVVKSHTPHDDPDRSLLFIRLGLTYKLVESLQDNKTNTLQLAAESLREAALSPSGRPLDRIRACQHLIELNLPWRKVNLAFTTALGLVPKFIWIGKSIEQRYKDASLIADLARGAAAFAFSRKQPHQALEWLEMGRGVILKQTMQLLPRFVKLPPDVDQSLGDRFRRVSKELADYLMTSKNGFETEEIKQKVHRLAEEHEKLVKTILQKHDIPGLRPKTAQEYLTIVNSVKIGPVVVINVHQSRSDVVILLPKVTGSSQSSEPGHDARFLSFELKATDPSKSLYVRLQKARYDLNKALKDAGIRERTKMTPGISTTSGNRVTKAVSQGQPATIEDVLAILWKLVAKPILDKLNYQKIPVLPNGTPDVDKKPVVTWCGTGPLSFLPLHAAGNYKNPTPGSQDMVANYAVSSYTPTLHLWASMAALPLPNSPNPFMLAIAQARTPEFSSLPGTRAELNYINAVVQEYNAKDENTQQKITLEALVNQSVTLNTVLGHLGKHNLVHIACHAVQDVEDPLKSAIILQDGKLTVGQLLKSPLQQYNRYIFLSACETSKGNLQSDEPFHLAAAMLFRFFGVVATRWAINDDSAPHVAKVTYQTLLENGWNNYGALAKALHIAVYKLWTSDNVKLKRFTEWVCFVHFGF